MKKMGKAIQESKWKFMIFQFILEIYVYSQK